MRKIILSLSAATLLMAPALASAQPARSDRIEDRLPHPFEIEEAGDRFARAVDALMDVPVGHVVQSFDPSADVSPDETIGDVAGHGDPEFRSRVQDRMAGMTMKLADAMRMIAAAAPKLRESLDRFERDLGEALPERR